MALWDARLSGRWRLGELFGLAALASVCLLPAALLLFPRTLVLHIVLVELVGLLITVPAAGVIAREREQEAWDALRATQLSSLEIAASKLTAVLYLASEGLAMLAGARVVATVLAIPLLVFLFLLPAPAVLGPGFNLVGWAVVMIAAYAAFVYRPILNAVYGACLGLVASTLARTTPRAVALSLSLQAVLFAALVAPAVWFMQTDRLAAVFASGVLAGRLHAIFLWLLPLAAVTAARLAIAAVAFIWAVQHMRRLVD